MVIKILITIFAIVAFLCLGIGISLQYHYMWNMPKAPHAELSRIYPLNIHGTVVYLTHNEQTTLQWLHWIIILSSILFLVLLAIYQNINYKKLSLLRNTSQNVLKIGPVYTGQIA